MGFVFFLIYLVLSFVRPWEVYDPLRSLPIITIATAAAVGATLLSLFMGRGPTARSPHAYLALAFFLWVVFSFVAATQWLGGAPDVINRLLPSLLMFFLAFLNVDTVARMRATAVALALVAVVIVGQAALAYQTGYKGRLFLLLETGLVTAADLAYAPDLPASEAPEGAVVRIRGVGSLADPNDLAQALLTMAPLLFALRVPGRRFRNILLAWMPVALILYGVGLTRSRGGLIALLTLFFFAFRQRLGRVVSLGIAGGAALGLLALGFTGGRAIAMDESSEGRVLAWYEGLQMLQSAPIWGVGFGNFSDLHTLVAHNSFVHCFAETGLVGYFLWLWLIVLTFKDVFALSKRDDLGPETAELANWGRALHLSLIAFLTGALFLSRTYTMILFLILGLGAAVSDMTRREEQAADEVSALGWVPRIVALEALSILAVRFAVQGLG